MLVKQKDRDRGKTVCMLQDRKKPVLIYAIAGSPVKAGNTDRLLDAFLRGASGRGISIYKAYACDLDISHCDNCRGCWETGLCTRNDGMCEVYGPLMEADIVIIAAPVYFMGLPSGIKSLIDRCQSIWVRKYVLGIRGREGRKGYFISTGGAGYKNLFTGSKSTVSALFATCDIKYSGEILMKNIDLKNNVCIHPTALRDAFKLGMAAVKRERT